MGRLGLIRAQGVSGGQLQSKLGLPITDILISVKDEKKIKISFFSAFSCFVEIYPLVSQLRATLWIYIFCLLIC